MVVQYLKHILTKRQQFRVEGMYTAEDVFAYLQDHTPDVIILDTSISEVDGIYVCKEIRKNNPTIPIIIITAELDPNYRFSAYQAGANDFIAKPFNSEEILSHIKHHLHLSTLDFIPQKFLM